ncbi:MAG: hypothetical protein CMJ78_12770 [Planctomycetaceae bacterium]|nr:hypothetical protein [Planctomycetaceae bacterium]
MTVIEAFLEEYESLHQRMLTAIKSQDADSLSRAAHSVKSAVRLFGDENLIAEYEDLERIEEVADIRDSLPRYRNARDGIDEIVDELTAFMESQ